ncbi:MAG: CHAD domain-containing protein [Candidatus Tectimicrobiota bacterium]
MTSILRPAQPGTLEVRRLLRQEMQQTLHSLTGPHPLADAAVHRVRKHLKQGRAYLRLLRKALDTQTYAAEKATLRAASRLLGGVREARVYLDTLDRLSASRAAQGTSLDLHPIRSALHEDYCEVRRRVLADDSTIAAVEATLHAVRARAREWPLRPRRWGALGAGVKRTYRQGRKALARAQEEPSAEHFHAWRKQVKCLGYQLQVFQPLRDGQLMVCVEQADILAQHLGEEHDLARLAHRLQEAPDSFPADATLQALTFLIASRRSYVQEQAIALGQRLYADKPATFANRLHTCWRTWRRQNV